jgi:CarboxypepD_reg-like domain
MSCHNQSTMTINRVLIIIMCVILRGGIVWAQQPATPATTPTPVNPNLVQFSGLVVTEESGRMVPVPYAGVFIPNRKTGTTANYQGFFSIVAEKGETVHFSSLGFRKATYTVPASLKDDRYSMVQILSKDTILLDEAIIFPWPSRDHFKTDFLAMNINDELQKRAMENLAAETLDKVREVTAFDGRETGSIYLRQQARNYYYYGQTPPMNIFNPIAWQSFFQSWKNGDFKKKKKNSGG